MGGFPWLHGRSGTLCRRCTVLGGLVLPGTSARAISLVVEGTAWSSSGPVSAVQSVVM